MSDKFLRFLLRVLVRPVLSPKVPVKFQRAWLEIINYGNKIAKNTSFDPIDMNGVPGRIIAPESPNKKVVLYLHGGGFILGSTRMYRGLTSHLAAYSNATVYSVDYRLAPEHDPYVDGLGDAVAAYKWLLEQNIDPADITVAGDSAGGSLTAILIVSCRDQGIPVPGKAFMIAPFFGFTMSDEDLKIKSKLDPYIRQDWVDFLMKLIHRNYPENERPYLTLLEDLRGFPETLIHVGTDEILLDDSWLLAENLEAAGAHVHLQVFENYWHVFQLLAGKLAMAETSLRQAADFIKEDIASSKQIQERETIKHTA